MAVQVTYNVVILSEHQRVEGSSHFVEICRKIDAKILRLRRTLRGFAQNDRSFLLCI